MTPRPATAGDLEGVRALLRASGLPEGDLTVQLLAGFLVLRDAGRVVGAVGLQAAAPDGLLRSLVVAPDGRGQGRAGRLVEALERRARDAGVRRLFLLTFSAGDWFAARGWADIGRDAVPAAIRATAEFSRLCPGDARAMTRALD